MPLGVRKGGLSHDEVIQLFPHIKTHKKCRMNEQRMKRIRNS